MDEPFEVDGVRYRYRTVSAERGCVTQILQEIDEAASLLAELLGTPGSERRALLEGGVRFQSLQL